MSDGINFPQDIIIDILSRLPVKSLSQFKCVSKPWRTLISDPKFIRRHLNQHKNEERVILISKSLSLYSVNFDVSFDNNTTSATTLHFPFSEQALEKLKLMGSCNGLLLVDSGDKDTRFLLNPSTRKYKKVSIDYFYDYCPVSTFVLYGLGYDSSTDDYKFVKVTYHDYEGDDEFNFSYELTSVTVYSLKTGVHKNIHSASPFSHSFSCSSRGLFINGFLHWLAFGDKGSPLIAFDLANENFCEVPLPVSVDSRKMSFHELAVVRGCLCMLARTDRMSIDLGVDVWVMEEYGIKESWTKYSIIMPAINYRAINPVCSLRDGNFLLKTNEKKFVVFNPNEETMRDIVVHGIPDMFKEYTTYGESLVSPADCVNEIVSQQNRLRRINEAAREADWLAREVHEQFSELGLRF